MKELFLLLKKGNKSAFLAAIINAVIAIIKGFAYVLTGNVAMFAETLHSWGDTVNQFFVFIGSALSKKAPTNRFPNGFGRLVNLVLLGAVLIVGIMAYETILEGYHHIVNPIKSSGFFITVIVLAASVLLESSVLYKAMKETLNNAEIDVKGLKIITKSFKHVNKAKPATKLVLLEDTVATGGGLLALIAVVISQFTAFHQAEGIASIIIGLLMFVVVGKVFLDNAAGALGEADETMQDNIGRLVLTDPAVKDVPAITVLKEGGKFHVEIEIEMDSTISLANADDIKDRLEKKIMNKNGVTDVIIEFDEDDDFNSWGNRDRRREK